MKNNLKAGNGGYVNFMCDYKFFFSNNNRISSLGHGEFIRDTGVC